MSKQQTAMGELMQLPTHLTDGFQEFRKAYPRRPNECWGDATHKAWARALRRATRQEIMDGLGRYRFSADPKFRPMAATWLNRSGWMFEDYDLGADPYGLREFLAGLTAGSGEMSALSYEREAILPILIATGWEPAWRGDLGLLNAWLRDGYLPGSIALLINTAVAKHGTRGTLKAFDGYVRYHAERFAHQAAAE